MFLRRGSSRGDGTVPSGSNRKGSVGRGDVFVVDEDTDLLDPIFQNGGRVNPQWKPSRNGLKGSQKGKPEQSSKHLEENITTDKKATSDGRTSSLFPGKPTADIIDLDDVRGAPKKPSVEYPVAKTPQDPRTSTESAKVGVEDRRPITNGRQPEKEHPAIVTMVTRDGDLVLGSDGKTYRLQRGPAGRMGPPGEEVGHHTDYRGHRTRTRLHIWSGLGWPLESRCHKIHTITQDDYCD
ncbi:uncharacterized protein LOC131992894 [Centropristis striata]|uniref:uncharacterized protein LOC131992894 n=1 Tax=Centropristis striata TaxID=184440 RepID=UPI0027E1F475|nr:uncharacterized protein LOC131992894 [Centropristis striata]